MRGDATAVVAGWGRVVLTGVCLCASLAVDASAQKVLTVTGTAIRQGTAPHLLRAHTLFAAGDSVTVTVADVNPFLYQARLRDVNREVNEPAIEAFLQLAFGFVFPEAFASFRAKANPPAPPDPGFKILMGNRFLDACSEAKALFDADTLQYAAALRKAEEVLNVVVAQGNALKSHEAAMAPHEKLLASDTSRSPTVRAAVTAIKAGSDTFLIANLSLEKWPTRLAKITKVLESLRDSTPVWRQRALPCDPANDGNFVALAAALNESVWKVRELGVTLSELIAARTKIVARQKQMADVLDDPARLAATLTIGPFRTSTETTIILERRPAGSTGEWTELDRLTITFGEPRRFALGFGTAWSGIVSRTYSTITQRAAVTTGTSDSLVSTISLATESRGRITPVVTLDMRLTDNFSVITGASYRVAGSTFAIENVEYLAGAGFTLIDRRLLIGGGFMVGRQERLGAGYAINSVVPASLTALPKRTDTVVRPTAMIVFRFP